MALMASSEYRVAAVETPVERSADQPRGRDVDRATEAARRVRDFLIRANYTEQGFRRAGVAVAPVLRRRELPAVVQALGAEEPLSSLIRVFALGLDADRRAAEQMLGDAHGAFVRLGLVERHGRRTRGSLQLTPWEGLVVAHDAAGDVIRRDHVLGPVASSRTLAQLTVRASVSNALDLGTGSGVQALLAARHAKRVVATDINRRALAVTALNAQLNDVRNIEVRGGNLFEPVTGERFGLVVSSPPFVISPDDGYLFRDAAMNRDEISRSIVVQAGEHLDVGGFATVVLNWVQRRGEDWPDRPAEWTSGIGCDALLIHYATEDTTAYASRWNAHLKAQAGARYRGAVDRWLSYYHREGIETIASGAVVLRGTDRSPWMQAIQMEFGCSMNAGRQIQTIFANRDFLASLRTDDELLTGVIRPVSGTRLDRGHADRAGGEVAAAPALVRPDGLGVRGRFHAPWLADVLLRPDGSRNLGETVDAVARDAGADVDAWRRDAVRSVRLLLERGLLEARVTGRAQSRAVALGSPRIL